MCEPGKPCPDVEVEMSDAVTPAQKLIALAGVMFGMTENGSWFAIAPGDDRASKKPGDPGVAGPFKTREKAEEFAALGVATAMLTIIAKKQDKVGTTPTNIF